MKYFRVQGVDEEAFRQAVFGPIPEERVDLPIGPLRRRRILPRVNNALLEGISLLNFHHFFNFS